MVHHRFYQLGTKKKFLSLEKSSDKRVILAIFKMIKLNYLEKADPTERDKGILMLLKKKKGRITGESVLKI